MKIGIIGAGFTGLSAAYELLEQGHEVVIFEKDEKPGGLALGFKLRGWDWSLEEHYHHLFTSDKDILELAKKVGVEIIFSKPKTSMFYKNGIHQIDNPVSLMRFPHMPLVDRVRTGLIVAYLKVTPFWKPLEKVTAQHFLKKYMGNSSWQVLWKPLFISKFGKYLGQIPASWFWARIKKRSSSLGYPEGGFQKLADKIAQEIKKKGGKIYYKKGVTQIIRKKGNIELSFSDKSSYGFDRVICTLPMNTFCKITKGLTDIEKYSGLKGLGVVTMVLLLDKSFLRDKTYWLNINDVDFPITAVVEHTNYIDKDNYNGKRILYVSKYLEPTHIYLETKSDTLFLEFEKYLKMINKDFDRGSVLEKFLFKSYFAQPLVPLNYSSKIPPLKTSVDGLFLANMQQVYPWDRGTNYAVELGKKVAGLVTK